jgi:ferrous iron transport protein B
MAVLYHSGEDSLAKSIKKDISFATAISIIIMVMFYSPCLAAMSTFYAEVPQWAWRTFYTIYPNVFAWIMAFIAYHILV